MSGTPSNPQPVRANRHGSQAFNGSPATAPFELPRCEVYKKGMLALRAISLAAFFPLLLQARPGPPQYFDSQVRDPSAPRATTGPELRRLSTQDYPEGVRNTEDPKNVPLAPEEALKRLALPEGFRATLFAAEPDVAQPISIAFDDRGRLWVAECYSYESSGGPWNRPVKDRILILEDVDGDGRFDKRKIFRNGARNLTSILPGFGGVWACSTPNLIFIPDRDRDDAPDGEPEVLLDGWNDGKIGH